uniref:mRNA capping enzyme adenylation domain-containing protein n=1 Tax=viral metagenome TaxID=1070528 RepID=A0A6C0KPJ0_9ZZZZ
MKKHHHIFENCLKAYHNINIIIMKSQNEYDLNSVLEYFPKFELSYEKIAHKKVHNANILLAIPEGKKYFAWFTTYKEDNVCFLLEIGDDNQIKHVKLALTSFSDKLVLGTIFYGTLFKKDIDCFCIEDLYFYKGMNCIHKIYSDKLAILKSILKEEMSQNCLFNHFTIFGLPLLSCDFNMLIKEIETLPYKVSQIKFRFFEKNNSRKILFVKYFKPANACNKNHNNFSNNYNSPNNNNLQKAVFKVTPDLEPDIYNLFIYNDGKEEYYDYAFIPDYKTSVMMNKLFRNIKENDNLDSIEESDDENEFQDEREDKFVFLDRSFKMNCEFNSKFRRWVPNNLADKNDRLISSNILSKKYK